MKPSRAIPKRYKKALISEAGGKCANPGCPNTRVEYHHIKEWAIVQTHNQQDMIAICPTCHDAAHHGTLKITEDILYEWKKISRTPIPVHSNIFIEPGVSSKVILGSVAFMQREPSKTTVFSLSPMHSLEFEVRENFLNVSTKICDQQGAVLLKVSNNNITNTSNGTLTIDSRPGRFRVTAPTTSNLISNHALGRMREIDSNYASGDILTVLDIFITKPGHVKIEGFWSYDQDTIVSTDNRLCFIDSPADHVLRIEGKGEDTCFIYSGPTDQAIFAFAQR
ncbi:HNH endonuclease signature motif containing protein [Pseudomonas putida]|uniref:HNH endonuclease signature motif containing protein n=1 Tax=Pseudomonas putida TaxID=303 RepID=UPI0011231540|nr:HNH endonuclease signature motif containing protein [Pseudomonas putida]